MSEGLLIGDLSKKFNISTQSIRYYERIGLINPPKRTESKYRIYSNEDESKLRFILQAKQFGLSLDDIKELINLSSNNIRPCEHLKSLLERHIRDVINRIQRLEDFRSQLIDRYEQVEVIVDHNEGNICKIIESESLK
ncbi:MerR family transcriptional regulator (plasmid) [Alkalihalobacillus hwajinpoensis]|uniref:MerR family transcriptional regulator n=1 Tax=Guptibacillus hwajinpoensis TaxID=208199 RepID=UPI001883A43D|nr:MerR family transcriptional regulator [Pseudalkalibacillus hwajinpoensis]MBF0706659.1 MerR family transcriptional regulator [Pseudalkalibacillus hwajinpoensis]